MSFLNPGDIALPGGTPLPDTCVGFDCGAGVCVTVNMTPTCVCERGRVAVGWIDDTGNRRTECRTPTREVPASFYNVRLPDLPVELPGGRVVDVPDPEVMPSGGACGVGGAGASGGIIAFALFALVAISRRRR
jgi:MYXO-CTERM domain-containing protein